MWVREIKGVTTLCSVPPVGGCSHCRCALSIGHSYKSGSAQYGANLLQLAANNFPFASGHTHLKKGSDFIPLQIRLNSWLLLRRHGETDWGASRELLAGWNHGVSRCHSSFSRRLTVRLKRAECHRSGCAVESLQVPDGFKSSAEQAPQSPAHCGGPARDLPQFVASLTVAVARLQEPMALQLCGRDYKSSAHWLPAGLAVPPPLPFIRRVVFKTWMWSKMLIRLSGICLSVVPFGVWHSWSN